MSNSDANLFVDTRKPRSDPLGMKWKPSDVPLARAIYLLQASMFELDALIAAALRAREVKVMVVEANKDRNGAFFKRAQKAALEVDRLTDEARSCREAKMALWNDVAALWAKYSGSAKKGAIAAYWLCSGYGVARIARETRQTKDFVVDVLFGIRNFFADALQAREAGDTPYKRAIIEKWSRLWGRRWNPNEAK